jgi:hypothetical protein
MTALFFSGSDSYEPVYFWKKVLNAAKKRRRDLIFETEYEVSELRTKSNNESMEFVFKYESISRQLVLLYRLSIWDGFH